ncbi:hypothetical protein BC827DRAFT_1169774 [Russula dissimulans]|nr:hypothetical protein BC827DRAFT_1169774 [Russula dissimulans]
MKYRGNGQCVLCALPDILSRFFPSTQSPSKSLPFKRHGCGVGGETDLFSCTRPIILVLWLIQP